ncbi:copper homeostasis protein CutC [Ceratobasidium sp. AG-Ba]|nr:copper homeostasis protein CutC [Ceratobasidium sp. AG-Ba]
MVRPRVGDFVYSPQEFETMLEDVAAFRDLGVSGVVFGVLTPNGSVDVERCSRVVEVASPMEVTFHRAFDLTADPFQALSDIAGIPDVTRILTSGHATPRANEPASLECLARLAQMVSSAQKGRRNELRIMPGSGINSLSINSIFSALYPLGVQEYHMSGGSWTDGLSEKSARREGKSFQMGQPGPSEWSVWKTNADSIKAVVDACMKLQ